MRWLALAMVAAGCSGNVGTLNVSLTTAPGSTLLDGVETLRLVITNPHTVTTAQRTSMGFDIVIDLAANGDTGALIVDGLDASGAVIATGATPAFPVGAIDAKLVVYMAAPNSVGLAPLSLDPARSDLAAGVLAFGAIFAGGTDATGAPTDAIQLYNAYDHSLASGLALLAPRSGLSLGVGAGTAVYLFGGRDATGTPTGSLWRFDTSVTPNGAYADYGDKTGFERADQVALPIGNDQFVVSGAPVAELSGLDGMVVSLDAVATLPPAGATTVATDGITTTIFAGAPPGVVRYRNGTFDTPAIVDAARTGNGVVALPGGKVGVVCGGSDLLRIDAASEAVETFPQIPSSTRSGCAIAATSRHLVVAGGTLGDGTVSSAADVYDATTLAPIASAVLVVPRTGASAIALPNDQVLIAGGVDATGAPVDALELFTPESLE